MQPCTRAVSCRVALLNGFRGLLRVRMGRRFARGARTPKQGEGSRKAGRRSTHLARPPVRVWGAWPLQNRSNQVRMKVYVYRYGLAFGPGRRPSATQSRPLRGSYALLWQSMREATLHRFKKTRKTRNHLVNTNPIVLKDRSISPPLTVRVPVHLWPSPTHVLVSTME